MPADTFSARTVNAAAIASGHPAMPDALAQDLAAVLDSAHAAFWREIAVFMDRHHIPGDDLGWSDPTSAAMISATASLIAGNLPGEDL